ncbi:MAG: TFIIB-type zinc ribbon-containing protein, partial [Candidatus Aenigmatarchaeota archaeon]
MAKKKERAGQVCPECGSSNLVEDPNRGEMICKDCGLVIKEELIDTGQEWRAFDSEQMSRRARGGAPLTFTKHDKGMTTEIGKGVGELYKVPAKKRAQYYRLTKWHKRLIKSKDRNLSFALSELQRIVSFLNLSKSIHERIARYYEEAVNKGLVRGRSIESVIAALAYAVSREFGSPRTLDEISEASGVEKREIGRTY